MCCLHVVVYWRRCGVVQNTPGTQLSGTPFGTKQVQKGEAGLVSAFLLESYMPPRTQLIGFGAYRDPAPARLDLLYECLCFDYVHGEMCRSTCPGIRGCFTHRQRAAALAVAWNGVKHLLFSRRGCASSSPRGP